MTSLGKVALTVVAVVGTLIAVWPDRATAVATTCESFVGPDCGGGAGDAACADPVLDCVDTGNGCSCQPRACCRCDGVGGGDNAACDLPCEDATLDTIKCPSACFAAGMSGATCNLTVMADKRCTDGTCVPTGCCDVTINNNDSETTLDICVTTDAATCATAPDAPGHFIAGGRCDGGVMGSCVPAIPNGGSCTSSPECQSGFCADSVCCNTACDAPGAQCNLPGQSGTCAGPPAPAPVLAPLALVLSTTLLAGIAALALRRRRAGQ